MNRIKTVHVVHMGTNFPMWCEDDMKFRFAITLESAKNLQLNR